MRAGFFARIVAVFITVASTAPAQAPAVAAAAELFQQGRELLKQRRFEEACAKLAESQRLDARVGTLLNLADCEESMGKLVDARTHWQQAAALAEAHGDGRVDVARQRFLAMDARTPKLTIRLAPNAPPDVTVERDGVAVGAAALGTPLPVEPGHHALRVAAPGFATKVTSVDLAEGEKREVIVEVGPKQFDPASDARTPDRRNGLRLASWISGGAALVAASGGAFFALRAKGKLDDSNAHGCDAQNACDEPGLTERAEAVDAGNVATVFFVTAGVLATLGVVLWFVSPTTPKRGAGDLVVRF